MESAAPSRSADQPAPPHIKGLRAAFFDIDGTLTSFTTHAVPESAVLALHRLQSAGIKLFICSGRAPSNLAVVTNTIPIDFDGVVALNGQYCFDDQGFTASRGLEPQDVHVITDWLDHHGDVVSTFCEKDYVYLNQITPALLEAGRRLGKTAPAIQVDDPHTRIDEHETYQISPFIDVTTQNELTSLCHNVKGERWHPDFVDLMPADGGKSVGMSRLLEHYGFDRSQTIAFGDGGNDISMLRYAGLGIAMGNGTQEARQAADYVTDDVDNEGIANALRHFSII